MQTTDIMLNRQLTASKSNKNEQEAHLSSSATKIGQFFIFLYFFLAVQYTLQCSAKQYDFIKLVQEMSSIIFLLLKIDVGNFQL